MPCVAWRLAGLPMSKLLAVRPGTIARCRFRMMTSFAGALNIQCCRDARKLRRLIRGYSPGVIILRHQHSTSTVSSICLVVFPLLSRSQRTAAEVIVLV